MVAKINPHLAITQNPQVPETIIVDFKGLYDYPNQFSPERTPSGALQSATNCVIESPGRIDSRRGFGVYGNTTGTPSQGLTFATYAGGRLIHADDNRIYKDNSAGQFQSISNTQYPPPGTYAGSRVRFVEQNGNLYFNSNSGIYKLQSLNATPILAGGPMALGGNCASVNVSSSNGPLPAHAVVAYRALWEYTDQNGVLIRGVPSNPVLANNINNQNGIPTVNFTIPTSVDTTWTFRLYRSNYGNQTPPIPDDNCQLVYSVQPNAAQISARTISFTDNVADLARGETLYTTTQGIAQAEFRPPIAQDVALYKGSMFYGNCKTYQQLLLTLQTDNVLQANDNVSFWQGASLLFSVKAGASEDAPNGIFKIFNSATNAFDIDLTAQSLCNTVNYCSNNTVLNAYYQSVLGVSQPGQMEFIMRTYSDTPFYVTCSNTSNPALFSPPLPSSGNNVNNLSTNDNFQHYVYFSKSLQPEAVPLNNFFAVGSRLTPIQRLIPMRDTLIIIKTDGLYALTGTDPTNFTVYPMDVQQNLVGVNTPAVLNNILYFLGQQGLVQMDEYGNHQIISLPLQQTLMQYTANGVYPTFASASWAMPYQAAHKYILWTITSPSDTTAQQAFVYDWTTQAWTTWKKNFTCGTVDPVLGTAWFTNFQTNNLQVYQERKNLNDTDYADEQYALTITGNTSANVLTVNAIPSSAVVGDSLYQSPFISVITAIDNLNNKITVADTLSWNVSNAAANVLTPIPVTITTAPIYANDPTQQKQYPEFSIILDGTAEATFNVSVSTDAFVSATNLELIVPGTTGSVYGVGSYGTGPFGGTLIASSGSRLRSYLPASVQKCNWLSFTLVSQTAFARVSFSGLQLVYRPLSTRQK